MRFVFGIIVLIHGLIHLKGFFNAFFSAISDQRILSISKPIGLLWFISFALFMASGFQFFTCKHWYFTAFTAIFLSQILIIMSWHEAKFGTLINVVILIVGLSAYGHIKFQKMLSKETTALLSDLNKSKIIISEKDLKSLPEIAKTWLIQSGVVGKKRISNVHLTQTGELRTKPNGKWMPFKAKQYNNCTEPSFIWSTNVKAIPLISIIGRDKLIDGKGEMQIKLASLISLVNEKNNNKINQGAMLRYLAEICWFPSAAISKYISWESINETSAKATFRHKDQSVSGVFSFSENGDFVSFTANRYYGGGTNATLEKWHIEALSYKEFNGIKIPNKSKVTWKLPEGDFHWLNLEITDIDYNISQYYDANS